ncbi:MAG: phosphopantetheine-binding protein [Coxiellaceae bacterium]|nr:phosphopantetheine-binding protein [Coxiellaceae bacterium]
MNEAEARSQIRALVKNILDRTEDDAQFSDSDSLVLTRRLDSLHIVELAALMEEHFKVNFAERGFNQYDFDDINEMLKLVNPTQEPG